MNALAPLSRFALAARRASAPPTCELCAAPLTDAHRHVVDREGRKLLCACPCCALLFTDATRGKFRTVPERVRSDPWWAMTEERWRALGIPVKLAFIVYPSHLKRWVALLPGPAGVTEAEINPAAWAAVLRESPLAASVERDVEALLVRGQRDGSFECFAAPVDVCYELTAVTRSMARGPDGGVDGGVAVDAFFARLSARGAGVELGRHS